jgi:hypothetical protein
MKILDLSSKNDEKWNTGTKEKKKACEIDRIRTRQDNEYNALVLKMNSELNEFNIKRKQEYEK